MQKVKPWQGQAAQDALARIKRRGRAHNTPCVICHRPIDYDLPSTNPQGCTVQHLQCRRLHPSLTWVVSNQAPAHKVCNERWGDRDMPDDWDEPTNATNATSGW